MFETVFVFGVPGVTLILLLFLVFWAQQRWRALDSLTLFVRNLNLDGDGAYESLDARFGKEAEEISSAWATFRDSLVKISGGERRRSTDAGEHFHTGELVDPVLMLDFTRHVPGILTGVGIICTFFGMKEGLGTASRSLEATPTASSTPISSSSPSPESLVASQNKALTDMVQKLLHQIEPAIKLSLVAVGAAIFFLFVERLLYSKTQSKLIRLQRVLDRKFSKISEGSILQRLASISDSIREHSYEAMNSLKGQNTDFAIMLEQAMAKAIGGPVETRRSLISSVDDLGQKLDQSLGKIGADASNASSKTLEQMMEKFQNSLLKGADSQIKDMLSSIEGVKGLLEGQREAQSGFVTSISKASEKLQAEVLKNQKALAEESSKTLGGVGKDVAGHLARSQEHQSRVLEEMRETFDNSLRNLSDQIYESSATSIAGFQGLLNSVEQLASNSAKSSQQALEQGSQATVASIESLSKSMLASTKAYSKELLETMQQFRVGFETSLDPLSSQVESSGRSSQETSASLLTAAQSLTSHVESSTKALAAQLQSGTTSSMNAVTQNLQELTKQQFGDVQVSMEQAIKTLMAGTETMLSESRKSGKQVNAQISELVARLDTFGVSAQSNNEKFAATVRQASQDIERLLGGVESPIARLKALSENFLEQTEHLETVSTQFGQASVALQESTEQMAAGLREAQSTRLQTDRSLVLAADLGKSVEQYQRGVNQVLEQTRDQLVEVKKFVEDFHIQATSAFAQMKTDAESYHDAFHEGARKFLHEVDANLSKGTGTLSGAIEELAEVLDEMREVSRGVPGKR